MSAPTSRTGPTSQPDVPPRGPSEGRGYLRLPAIHSGRLAFVTEDDLWTVDADGGRAHRLSADLLEPGQPAFSPDGQLIAVASGVEGAREVYVLPADGGVATRVTYDGDLAGVCGWTPQGEVVYSSAVGTPFPALAFCYAVTPTGGPPRRLAVGAAHAVSFGPGGGVVVGRNTADPARWKRYRGGTAGVLWIDPDGAGSFRRLIDLPGNLASPMWVGERVFFLSDHEGVGNIYSCTPEGTDLTRHTPHDTYYARRARTDGTRIVYAHAAALWILDPATGRSAEVEVRLGGPRTQRRRRFVTAPAHLGDYAVHPAGHALVADVRGQLVSFGAFAGPVVTHAGSSAVRRRLAGYLGDGERIVAVSDASGEDCLEVFADAAASASADPVELEPRRLAAGALGRVRHLVPAPDGTVVAVTNHRRELLVVDLADGAVRVVDTAGAGQIERPAFSPDSAWLAYPYPVSPHSSVIRLAHLSTGELHPVTEPGFADTGCVFDPAGRYLYFLSGRHFAPVYDSVVFDLGFPAAVRPYAVTLAADTRAPFPVPPGPPEGVTRPDAAPAGGGSGGSGPAGGSDATAPPVVPPVRIDTDGLPTRIVEVPLEPARYEGLFATAERLLALSRPVEPPTPGMAATARANGRLEALDLATGHHEELLTAVADLAINPAGTTLAYRTTAPGGGLRLRVVAAAKPPDAQAGGEGPGPRSGWVDLDRVRVAVDPGDEWRQMLAEAWRLQRDQFWVADMSGVDWELVWRRYAGLVDLVATRTEFSDLIWEMQGELGTSHAYELGGDHRRVPDWGVGKLGAELDRDAEGRWVVARRVDGDSWDPESAGPLAAPGVDVRPGDAIEAVDGTPVSPATSPAALLVNRAGVPVELVVARPGGARRRVVVTTLRDERALRYRDWVSANRAWVREATGGRAGYLHIPDMMAPGFAEFHRAYLTEAERDGLVVDARYNRGGHVSGLLLEKLARRRLGYDVSRWDPPIPYPPESPAGPMVLLTNEHAGSDGDIFTEGFKRLGLGPVLGTRTWGGVIGINPTHPLVDGTIVTQPEYSFWFISSGWAVENHGSDPDELVEYTPEDYRDARDPQLARSVEVLRGLLERHVPVTPDLHARPRLPVPGQLG